MVQLKSIIESEFLKKKIDLDDEKWHLDIPNQAGWYFIETDTPLEILLQLSSPPLQYTNDKGELKKCKNYDIASRTEALVSSLLSSDIVIERDGMRPIYSGMTLKLLNRAKQHTFSHKGTAGLALSNYSELKPYKWTFNYKENTLSSVSKAHKDIILKLGEQIWRANNGWPILCSN